jgi:hypothetical protein
MTIWALVFSIKVAVFCCLTINEDFILLSVALNEVLEIVCILCGMCPPRGNALGVSSLIWVPAASCAAKMACFARSQSVRKDQMSLDDLVDILTIIGGGKE